MNIIIFILSVWVFACFIWNTDQFTEFKKEEGIDQKKVAYADKFLPKVIVPSIFLILAIIASLF